MASCTHLAPWRLTVAYVLLLKTLKILHCYAKIKGGDLIALESKCHNLFDQTPQSPQVFFLRETRKTPSALIKERKMEARAFAELLAHIEMLAEKRTFLFKFSELRALYEKHLCFFGTLKE